ncbi:MAG: hypothetical protein KBT11_11990 [Treponema sp.]|nr:hypothetical protein [Candidatus Treponema equifaecale]
MKFQFLEVAEDDKKELLGQLKIAYKIHFSNAKDFEEVFEDWLVLEITVPNDLYFEDMEKAKSKMYEAKNNGVEPYMKDFISDLQENLSFVPTIKVENDVEYDPNYSFTVDEMKQIKEWQENHRIKNHPEGETYQGAVGVERFEYTLLGTSIGMIRNCFCKSCRDKYEEESKDYTTGSIDELVGKVKPKYSSEERRCKLVELENKWDYQIDFSDL